MIFVALIIAYLVVIILESTNIMNESIQRILYWIYIHLPHYCLNVLMYCIMEYLLILDMFRKQIYMILKDIYRKVIEQR